MTVARAKKKIRRTGARSARGHKAPAYPKKQRKPVKSKGARPETESPKAEAKKASAQMLVQHKAKQQTKARKAAAENEAMFGEEVVLPRKYKAPPTFTVAIVGRPNVGKSTLFNRLVGRREALVHDRPGVTRDRKFGQAELINLHFNVIDTAGFEEARPETLEGQMRRQTEKAVADADVALLLVDARAGITPLDAAFADLLRRSTTPIVLVANKCEGKGQESALYDAFRLGMGEPLPISAEHGQGLSYLYHALAPFAGPEVKVEPIPESELPPRPLQLAIIGRPNTGKSTLINRLLGEDRMLTGPEPGVTRDAVTTEWTYKGRAIRLVDTAGVRKRAKITDAVEKLSVGETFEAVKMAEVVVLVVEATAVLDNQELTLARHVIDEGRALVIAVNKWDAIKEKRRALETLEERLRDSLAQVKNIPTITISGLTGQRVDTLMEEVFRVHDIWNTRVPSAALNRWLASATQAHPPPLSSHKQRIKLRYGTQVKSRPPTFVLFSTRGGDLPEAYMRYLINGIRDTFGLDGVPIRIHLRKPNNPYEEEK